MREEEKNGKKKGWPYWRNLLLFTLAICFIAALLLQFVAYPYFMARAHTHPGRSPVCCQTPADLELDYEPVRLETDDGLALHGWYIPSRNEAAVVLLHGLAANRTMMLPPARILAEAGYGALLLDLRAHGESDGDVVPFGGPEREDVNTAVAYLQEREDVAPQRIGVLGWSLGAQVAILGAAANPDVAAVVADGPGATTLADWPRPQSAEEWWYRPFDFAYYRFLPGQSGVSEPVSLRAAVAAIAPRPLLLISAGEQSEKRRVGYLFAAAAEPKELWVIEEAGHLGGWKAQPELYRAKVISFFDEALLGKTAVIE